MKRRIFGVMIPPMLITREHGSWAVLVVPMLVNVYVAGRWSGDFVLVVLVILGAFLAYVPAQVLLRHHSGVRHPVDKLSQARFWGMVYAGVAICAGVVLLAEGYIFLLAIGGAGAMLFYANFYCVKHYSKMAATDLLAVAGLTLGGLSVYYVLTGSLDRTAFALYVLNFLFFGCSVFYVHMKIQFSASKRSAMKWREKLIFGKSNLLYFAALVVIVGVLSAFRLISFVVLIAFLPMIGHGVYGTVKLSHKVHFKKLGFILLGQSILFGSLLCCFM